MILKSNEISIKKCAKLLKNGAVGAFPTETVYGLAANALDIKAVARIFQVKSRPISDPLIVHISSDKELDLIAHNIPKEIKKLTKKFWPGPLTIVVDKKDCISHLVTAGLDTVAIRMPDHPVALKLIKYSGCPLAAPSANLFGRTSTTQAKEVDEELGQKIDFVLDGGASKVGVESTIVKYERSKLMILRPGGVSLEEIKKVLPQTKIIKSKTAVLDSPGQMDQHYAPTTPLIYTHISFPKVIEYLEDFCSNCRLRKKRFPKLGFLTFAKKPHSYVFEQGRVLSPKHDLVVAATRLFSFMRELDGLKLDYIIVETIPNKGLGVAINDRLTRASHGFSLETQFSLSPLKR